MISINNAEIRTADSIYGEFIEKEAFDASVIIPALVGSITGGITSNKAMNRKKEGIIRQEQQSKLDNDYYSDIGRLFQDLKVTFTPINVIYTVTGQTFEIISVQEMNEEMKSAHRRRDGDYFTKLLVNKMNMELQMAERYFARQLLVPQLGKEASFLFGDIQTELEKNDQFEKLASLKDYQGSVNIKVDFDGIRPFSENDGFLLIDKVASLSASVDEIQTPNLSSNVKVSFLPDRVIFTHDGTLIEQMSVMNMNEDGYKAFNNKDKDFFKKFFGDFVSEYDNLNKEASDNNDEGDLFGDDLTNNLSHSFENEEFYKTAATLDDIRNQEDWVEILAFDKEFINIFTDPETHPIVYDLFLDSEYGADWHENEIESIMKRIETEFLDGGEINDSVFNKLLILHTIQSADNSVFLTAFTFEKFVRALNGKSVQVSEIEGNLEFEEILLALEVAESICDYNIYVDLTDNVAAYVSEQLLQDNIRIVSKSIYEDENNEFKEDFWGIVNGYLLRKWKDADSVSLYGEESTASREVTGFIAQSIDIILENNAELLDFNKPYESSTIVTRTYFENRLDEFDEKDGIVEAISNTISRHLLTVMFLEIKKQESEFVFDKMKVEVSKGD